MAILTDDKFQNYDPFNPEPRLEEGRTPTPIRRYVSLTTQTIDPINMYFIKRGREDDNFEARSQGMDGLFEYQNLSTYRNRFLPSQILNEGREQSNPEFVKIAVEMGEGENYSPPVYRWSYGGTRNNGTSMPLMDTEANILQDTIAGNPPVFTPGNAYLLSIDIETGLSPRNSTPPYAPDDIPAFNLLDELENMIPSFEEVRESLGQDVDDRVQGFNPKPGRDPGARQPTGQDPYVFTSAAESFINSIRASVNPEFFIISSETGVFDNGQINQQGKVFPGTLGMLVDEYIETVSTFDDPSSYLHKIALINALKAYYSRRQKPFPLDLYKDYSFHNFKEEVPYLVDYVSYWALNGITSVGVSNNIQYQFMRGAASIKPNYNYNSVEYEEAIRFVPEAALPNLYMYSFLSEQDGGLPPPWQNERTELKQLQGDYDKLIKVGEFVKGTLPLLQMGDEGFRNYLENYAQATKDSILDFSSPQAQEYYNTRDKNKNLMSPASEMGFYKRLNERKSMFPMYIEMNIPTSPIGGLGTVIESTKTSTSFINSIARTLAGPADPQRMNVFTSGIQLQSSNPDPWNFYTREQPRVNAEIEHEGISRNIPLTSVESWLASAEDDIEDFIVLSEQGQERIQGQCSGLSERIQFGAIRNYINSQKNLNLIKYEDVIKCVNHDDNSPAYCQSETIAYKVVKSRLNINGTVELIQNFYFPNTSKENVIEFVDTQVKRLSENGSRQEYVYEIYGYAVVYGSKFRVRPDFSNIQLDYIPTDPEFGYVAAPVYFQYSVETIADPKIVEYPIIVDSFRSLTGMKGIGSDVVYINHRPPAPPDLSIHPYKENYRQVLMNIQPHSGEEFIGQNAIKYIKLSEEEFDKIDGLKDEAIYQLKFLNYSLKFPFLEFKSEGGIDIGRVEVYRTQDIPIEPSSTQALYSAFGSTPHKVLDIRRRKRDSEGNLIDVPPAERASAFDFVDNLEPNQKYYYTCRSSDMDEKKSNPGPIYEVELQYYEGVYNPVINLYEPPIIPPRKRDKRFVRFVEIKAADIQTYVRNFVNPQTEALSSEIGLTSTDVHNQKFIVRITSKDTGKKMDLKLSFTKDVPN